MKKFIIKIVILLLILVVIDLLIGLFYSYLIKKQNNGRYYKINYTLNEAREDIIILGSSRAETNYCSGIIEEKLGMSCWNSGRGGQGLLYFSAIQKEIFKRYNPEFIILNIDHDFLDGPLEYDEASILRPFARNHPAIFEQLKNKDKVEKYKLFSNIYVYNSTLYYLVRPFLLKDLDGKKIDKGWKPRFGIIPPSAILIGYSKQKEVSKQNINPEKLKLLKDIIVQAHHANTQLIFVISPDFIPVNGSTQSFSIIKKLADDHSIKVIDLYSDTSFIENKNLYYDLYHMNETGAKVFSEVLSENLIKIIKTNRIGINN